MCECTATYCVIASWNDPAMGFLLGLDAHVSPDLLLDGIAKSLIGCESSPCLQVDLHESFLQHLDLLIYAKLFLHLENQLCTAQDSSTKITIGVIFVIIITDILVKRSKLLLNNVKALRTSPNEILVETIMSVMHNWHQLAMKCSLSFFLCVHEHSFHARVY